MKEISPIDNPSDVFKQALWLAYFIVVALCLAAFLLQGCTVKTWNGTVNEYQCPVELLTKIEAKLPECPTQ